MECHEAREIIEKVIEGTSVVGDRSLDAHLKACRKCAGYLKELQLTWDILGAYPSIRPSPDFAGRLHRKIAEPYRRQRWSPGWIPALSWQWAVTGACVLVFGIFLTIHFSRTPALLELAPGGLDAQDEVFLQDLDQSLQQTTGDYLQVFDSWREPASDLSSTDQLPAEPATDSKERGKSPS
jgi:hypothetical protein